ncbi:MAG: hypothetical protein ACRDSR_12855 [Pseudonocardiaceae bacterium]
MVTQQLRVLRDHAGGFATGRASDSRRVITELSEGERRHPARALMPEFRGR